jgi:hypothetical protein
MKPDLYRPGFSRFRAALSFSRDFRYLISNAQEALFFIHYT